MTSRIRVSMIVVLFLAAGVSTGSLAAQPPRPRKAAEVDIKVEDLRAVFKKAFKADLNLADYRQVSLAINRWLDGNNRWEYSGFWIHEDSSDADGTPVLTVLLVKYDDRVDIKLDDLKAVFKKQLNAALAVNDLRQVGRAVNGWLAANKRGASLGLWDGEETDDGKGNLSYRIAMFKPDAALDISVEELKAAFKKDFNRPLDVQNRREVGLAVNRWLTAHQRGIYNGFWNGEVGNAVYRVALVKRDEGEPEALVYVPTSTKKVSQLTGDFDRATRKATLNLTNKRFGVEATDLGSSFEHKGKLHFLFGDTWGRPEDRDVLAWTTSTNPDNITLEFHKDKDGKWLPLTVPGIGQGAFEVPSGGISIGNVIYVACTTNVGKKIMARSVLASSHDDGKTFKKLYDLSNSKFINVALWQADGWLYIYGSGEYRKSNVCLARVKPTEFADRTKLQYFAGADKEERPRWSAQEADAVPLFQHKQVGEFSVAYLDPVARYVMLYNAEKPRGITMRSAPTPWGPWSEGTVVFEPWRDNGYGYFMHISDKFKNKKDALSDPGRADEWGGEYGPYVMARFTGGSAGACRIYYTMSTWNPYQVVVMRSDLKLQGK